MNLAAIDLKLLVVFDAVMAERNVTNAARRLGMSQPALSNALGRARHLLKDQLFTRGADGMRPTPRAIELSAPVREALRKLETTLEPPSFDAAHTGWTFKIGLSDHASIVMLPKLLRHICTAAPGVRLDVLPKANDTVSAALSAGDLDLAIGVIPPLARRFGRMALFDDAYVCVMRADHPLAHGPFTLKKYAAAEHLALRPGYAGLSGIDTLARQAGVQRNIVLAVNQFLAVAPLIRSSNMIASLFGRMSEHLDQTGLVIRPLPLAATGVQVVGVWNKTLTNHAVHRWLRLQLAEVGKDFRNAVAGCPTPTRGD
jgi:DNA-binding transcriptional LysR family regulator